MDLKRNILIFNFLILTDHHGSCYLYSIDEEVGYMVNKHEVYQSYFVYGGVNCVFLSRTLTLLKMLFHITLNIFSLKILCNKKVFYR